MKALHHIVILKIVFTLSTASLPEVLPIVWEKTEIKVILATSRSFFQFPIPAACQPLVSLNFPEIRRNLVSWCLQELDTSVVKPLEELCKPVYAKSPAGTPFLPVFNLPHQRKKRSPARRDEQEEKSRVDTQLTDLTSRIYRLHSNQEFLSSKIGVAENSIRNLSESIERTENGLKEIKNRAMARSSSFGEAIRLVSEINIYFQESRRDLTQMKTEWEATAGKSGFEMAKMLNIFQVPERERIKYYSMIADSCRVRDGSIHFDVTQPIMATDVEILEANPFTMSEVLPNSNMGIQLAYTGPRHVLYNSSSNCVVPYTQTRDLALLPSPEVHCFKNANAGIKYWTRSCIPLYYYDGSSIQIKAVDDEYYIYCFGSKITVYKKTIDCPPHVFSVHQNESIRLSLGGEDFGFGKILFPKITRSHSAGFSNKVTNSLMPKLLSVLFPEGKSSLGGDCSNPAVVGGGVSNGSTNQETAFAGTDSYLPLFLGIAALTLAALALGLAIFSVIKVKEIGDVKKRSQPMHMQMLMPDSGY